MFARFIKIPFTISDKAKAMLIEGNKVLLCGDANNHDNNADMCVSRYYLGVITNVEPSGTLTKINAILNPADRTQIILRGEFPMDEKTIISLLNSVGQVCEVWSSESIFSFSDEKT